MSVRSVLPASADREDRAPAVAEGQESPLAAWETDGGRVAATPDAPSAGGVSEVTDVADDPDQA